MNGKKVKPGASVSASGAPVPSEGAPVVRAPIPEIGLVVAARKCDIDGPAPGGMEAICGLGCRQTVVLSRAGQKRVALGWKIGCNQCVLALSIPVARPARAAKKPSAVQMRILSRMVRTGARIEAFPWGARLTLNVAPSEMGSAPLVDGYRFTGRTFLSLVDNGWIEREAGSLYRITDAGRKAEHPTPTPEEAEFMRCVPSARNVRFYTGKEVAE
jgi:hypothetical protein